MSISALTSEAARLIDVFQTKESGINSALNAAIAAVPYPRKTYYVDSVAGSDSNAGTEAAPFLTLGAAFALVTGTKSTNSLISLAADGAYLLPAVETSLYGSHMIINQYQPRGAGTPTITQPSDLLSEARMPGIWLQGSSVALYKVNAVTAASLPEGAGAAGLVAMFRPRTQGGVCAVTVSEGAITVQAVPFAANQYGFLHLGVRTSTIARPTGAVALLDLGAGAAGIAVGGNTLPGGADWSDDLITGILRNASGHPYNLIANINMSV